MARAVAERERRSLLLGISDLEQLEEVEGVVVVVVNLITMKCCASEAAASTAAASIFEAVSTRVRILKCPLDDSLFLPMQT